jgi:hypothetical protein
MDKQSEVGCSTVDEESQVGCGILDGKPPVEYFTVDRI